ncbi:glutamate--tRNA ligase [Zongyangia hominis]|uniref:Glutamate--tRNA ligase n=1 Tax=Zongyangia hominis TaxID=2763677 RepID=A0A926IBB3_9FIRM|nr:glutamate--tRNA ligase [Zongyangia hominis]MBC8571066.1 glutamate--tRNA ligase [Zongyangia hominis]
MSEKDNLALAELLFPDVTATPEEMEALYPPRDLPEGAKVTRMAPSPTGFMHLGNLFGAITDERLAHQSGGVFYLRIEDTDQKRAVEGGVETIIRVFDEFGLPFDEGATIEGDNGAYGPYRQRQRAHIYHTYAKDLVRRGLAYPCFCTEEELADMRQKQEAEKANFGYYGKWAVHRDTTLDEIKKNLADGKEYVLRFRASGDGIQRFKLKDLVKGELEMPVNDQDVVLLKSDGIPTYHFAHVIDDHLMHTTHVVRGEEWLATLPIHVDLFRALGFKMPKYVHTAQLMKMDGASKRKLSKRKDPELALDFYRAQGYPVISVKEYLMTLLNSNFEEWRLANPTAKLEDFKFTTNKMSTSGALFDMDKLGDVSKNTIALLPAGEVYEQVAQWSKEFDPELHALLTRDPAYATAIFQIGRGGKKPRKDIAVWSEVKAYLDFFFDELYTPGSAYPSQLSEADILSILEQYPALYDESDDQNAWFEKITNLGVSLGFAAKTKEYKQNPDAFKGHVGDVSMVLRVAVTGRTNSPDMYDVMRILGKERVTQRLQDAISRIKQK